MLLSQSLWGNRAEWQENDGALPTEGYRLLIPPGHPQLEDNPGLPSPYTGSPGELLKFDSDTLCMGCLDQSATGNTSKLFMRSNGPVCLQLFDFLEVIDSL